VFDAVRLWDIAGRCCVVRYVGHNYPVHSIDAWYGQKHFLASNVEVPPELFLVFRLALWPVKILVVSVMLV